MRGDNPIGSRAEDRLRRTGFADHLAFALRGASADQGLVVALIGRWGSGKTSSSASSRRRPYKAATHPGPRASPHQPDRIHDRELPGSPAREPAPAYVLVTPPPRSMAFSGARVDWVDAKGLNEHERMAIELAEKRSRLSAS